MDTISGIRSPTLSKSNGGVPQCISVDIAGRTSLSSWTNLATDSCVIEKVRPPDMIHLNNPKNFKGNQYFQIRVHGLP